MIEPDLRERLPHLSKIWRSCTRSITKQRASVISGGPRVIAGVRSGAGRSGTLRQRRTNGRNSKRDRMAERKRPAESGASLVHNDYKFDNVMLDPADLTRITAVLDWEMVTIGDPLMDLGTTLGYWMSREVGPRF